MKTAFIAKLIFETDKKTDLGGGNEFTYRYMVDAINAGNIEIECIHDMWTYDAKPVIIIREKP